MAVELGLTLKKHLSSVVNYYLEPGERALTCSLYFIHANKRINKLVFLLFVQNGGAERPLTKYSNYFAKRHMMKSCLRRLFPAK